jgi:hypothetical protein
MSRTYSKLTNKQQKRPKVHFQEYLQNTNEPQEYISHGPSTGLEIELIEDIESMRKSFRRLVNKMKSRYS